MVSLYELRHTYVSVNKEMLEGLKKMTIGHSQDMDTDGIYGHQMAGDLAKAPLLKKHFLKLSRQNEKCVLSCVPDKIKTL